MKRKILMLIGVLGLGISIAQSQTLLNSWENSLEGWTILESAYTNSTFSTTTGVTAGSYSWELGTGGVDYGAALQGPSSTALTASLANAASVSLDVLTTPGDFGWGMQWDLVVHQPGGIGDVSVDGYTYSQSPVLGTQSTLTWAIPFAITSGLAAHPGLPTYLTFQIGGGGGGTMYLDYLRVNPLGLINSWEVSMEGWTINEPVIWTGSLLSTTTGVTAGLYSWELTAASGPDYNLALSGPSSTALTALLANATNVQMDIDVPVGGSFGYYLQFDLLVNQPGGLGTADVSGFSDYANIGGQKTMTFIIPQAIRTGLLSNPTLPTYLSWKIGGGNAPGSMTMYLDNLRATLLPPAPANLWVRELWDDVGGEQIPANTSIYDGSSSAGFAAAPWTVNPAETNNCKIMAFRSGFNNEPEPGASTMGLPGTLDGSFGCMVQENGGFSFFPGAGQGSFWTAGDFMTRALTPGNYINFQAAGEYWFSMTIANAATSLDGNFVTDPATGAGGIGFADGTTTNANFVAVGVTYPDLYLGPGATNASKAVYISQGTLGQPGDPYSVTNSPAPTATYSQTNFTGGPYHINAFGAQTVSHVNGDYMVVLGHLTTHGDGTATLDAKYYGTGVGGNPWNTTLDMTTNSITWDCSYSFSYGGTMTRMLLFENGQFPFYVFGFRAGANFNSVVGLDPGRMAVAPLANTYEGYPINMTNLAVEANSWSFGSPPPNYGTLNYQWYTNGVPISGATSQYYNIASAALTDAGTYTCVATDPSGTWGSVTDSVVITVTHLNPPTMTGVQVLHNGNTFLVTYDEPNLTGVGDTNNYVFTGGVVATNAIVVNGAASTEVQIITTSLPLGTKMTLSISGVTNVVGGTLTPTNLTFWTDLVQTGVANWDCWLCPADVNSAYFNTFLPANPSPVVVQSMALTSWDGPSTGVTNVGLDGYVGDDFGDKQYGWFIPPVTTNYVFLISCDDGGRLSLSSNSSSTNLFVIACEGDWSGNDEWTNISNLYGQPGNGTGPHRGDGTASAAVDTASPPAYVWDNSVAGQSPATACLQNRSDQFIVAYYDSTGAPGGPPQATNQNWASVPAYGQVYYCVLPGMTNSFWPNRDANGQALIHLQAGQMYYMQLEHVQNGGGYGEGVTYKIAGQPDPYSGVPGTTPAMPGALSALTGSNIAGTVPFTPTISITESNGAPLITYTGVLLAGTNLFSITNVVVQSSASTAISLGGPSQYSPPHTSPSMFYRTSQ